MATYLTKNEELELGALIQKGIKAKELRETMEHNTQVVLEGETLTKNDLSKVIKAGDKAVEVLLENNTALVWSRARRYKSRNPHSPDLDDLVQEGYIGMLNAASKYDPTRDNKFSTVAFYWIDQAIARSVNNTGRMIRLPENRVQDFCNITQARARHEESKLSAGEIDRLVMEELNLTQTEFENITRAAALHTSLSRQVGSDDSGGRELIDIIADEHAEASSEELAVREAMNAMLMERLAVLTPLERETVQASFFMGEAKDKREAVRAVREEHSLTPQKFKRILNGALAKLKQELEQAQLTLDDYVD